MKCNGCVKSITSTLSSSLPADQFTISLETKTVTLQDSNRAAEIIVILKNAGFPPEDLSSSVILNNNNSNSNSNNNSIAPTRIYSPSPISSSSSTILVNIKGMNCAS